MAKLFFAAVVVCLLGAAATAHAYQVHPSASHPCVFQANGTCFDLRNVYPWPAKLRSGKYTYSFNPCEPLPPGPCSISPAPENTTTPRGDAPGIAMCQTWNGNMYASGGLLEPFATWNAVYPHSDAGDAVLEINFPYGAAFRNTKLLVRATNSSKPTLRFIEEAPLMQYNLLLEGADVFHVNETLWPCYQHGI